MRQRRFGPRAAVVLLIAFAVVIAFGVRLVDIQIVSAAALTEEATDRRAYSSPVYGERGNIVDRNGAVLADSVERYDITASPRVALGSTDLYGSVEAALAGIAEVTGQDPAQLLATITADPESDYAVLAEDLTLDEYEAVVELDIPWVYAERVQARTYPNGALAANLIGFMGTDEPLAGLERSQNECLAGQDGLVSYERSEDGVRIPSTVVVEQAAVDGGTLQLTIDRDLQWYAQETMAKAALSLGATWASAVVMRVSDGALMAVTDWPTLEPNDFASADPAVTGSRAFAIPYEPGSIMKPITAAIAIDAGLADVDTPVEAPTRMDFGDAGLITDATSHGANLTLTGGLVYSSNTAMSQFAGMVDDETRMAYYDAFGFNHVSEVDFTGESGGYIPELQDWDARTRLVMGYGQAMSSTIIQMASAYQTIGNDGVRVPPRLVESCTLADGTVVDGASGESTQVISAETASKVRMMMEMVAEHGGSWDALNIPGYRIGVKSGTAEVAENGVYTDKVVISYAGLVPIDDPQYVVIVSAGIPDSLSSYQIAPTFHDLAAQTITLLGVAPSTGTSVQLPSEW